MNVRESAPREKSSRASQEEMVMCPACLASTALIAGTIVTAGGIGAVIAKIFRPRNAKAPQKTATHKESE
jgi:hypothetical protein